MPEGPQDRPPNGASTRGRRRPRQVDIARLAAVSQTTVAFVLGGVAAEAAISKETERRVRDVARRLGYVPDPIATRLASGRNRLLGLYTFTKTFPLDVRDSYYPYMSGVEAEAAAQGYDLILFTASSAGQRSRTSAQVLQRMRLADGCLLLGRRFPKAGVRRLLEDGLPLVYIGRHDELGPLLPYVGFDYVTAASAVVDRMLALGHRCFRFVCEPDDTPPSVDRQRGVRRALEAAGLDAERAIFRTLGPEMTADVLRAWRAEGVTAVVCEASDEMAAARALTEAAATGGFRWPGDFSLALLGEPADRLPLLPKAFGFRVDRMELGRRAVRLLVRQLDAEGISLPDRQQLLDCPLLNGPTVNRPRS